MKSFKHILLPTLLSLIPALLSAQNPNENPEFRNLLNSVVRLDIWETSYKDGFKQTHRGQGSGVIITPQGHILTNGHVVNSDVEKIIVTLANLERVDAHFVGWDHWTDLAIVKLNDNALEKISFSHALFGNSDDLYLAQPVFAVGTPHGLTRTLTRGVISNNNRYIESTTGPKGHETGHFNTWLQTDAAINLGNSGGPLVTTDGKVIGINTQILLNTNNLGFAIPSNVAQKVMHDIILNKEVVRSYIGIIPKPLQDLENFYAMSSDSGLLVQNVEPDSPAKLAGVHAGDIILELDNSSLDGRFPEQLPPIMNKIACCPIGSTLHLKIKRGEPLLPLSVITEKLESSIGQELALPDWGLSLQKLSRSVAREKKLDSHNGFIVVGTQPGFPAQRAGLLRKDIILKVNHISLENFQQLQKVYEDYQIKPQPVLMEIFRNHTTVFLVLKP